MYGLDINYNLIYTDRHILTNQTHSRIFARFVSCSLRYDSACLRPAFGSDYTLEPTQFLVVATLGWLFLRETLQDLDDTIR
jgi:hypothetical protein